MSQKPINILIVDDRPENLISLAAVLDNSGYNLVKAHSGREALKCILDKEFALILLDVQMPILDGFETATLIKQRKKSKDIPIVFITANSKDEPFIFKGYDAGAVDYIFKPFDPSILRSKVSIFADLYRKTEAIREQAEVLRAVERAEIELDALRREQVANQRYRELVEAMKSSIVWSVDTETLQYTFVSSQVETITGYRASDLIKQVGFIHNHTHEDDRARFSEAFDRMLLESGDLDISHRFIRADGQFVWLHTTARVSVSGNKNEVRGLSADITELKQAEEIAKSAVKLRDEFLSIASHELKTPLTPLKLQLQILKHRLAEEVTSKKVQILSHKALESSMRQVDRLSKLIDELLDVSRINNGKLVLEIERLHLSELIKEICGRFSPDIRGASCTLLLEVEDGIWGRWDRLRIEQVFTNLLTNATRYGRGSQIEVSLKKSGDGVELSIADHGMGIAQKDQARIFKKFERAASSENFGGLGLGLYIVSKILNAHGGKIGVQSKVGEGSKFNVWLPMDCTSPQVQEGEPDQSALSAMSLLPLPLLSEQYRGSLKLK